MPALVWAIAAAVVLRAAAAATGPLIDDEAYYWLWAQRLAWGYLDHPPLVAWLIALTTVVRDTAWFIRLSPLVLGVATTYLLFLLGKEMNGVRGGLLAASLFQIVPVLAGAGLLATPDAALLAAWAAGIRFAWQALRGRPGRWLACGAAVGVGLLAKLTMAMLPLGLLLYAVLRARGALRRWEPYAAAALAAAIFSPVLFWNAAHGWAGVDYILHQRLAAAAPGITGVLKLLEEQMAFAALLLPAYVWALVAPVLRRSEGLLFLLLTSVPIIVFPFIPAYAGAWPHGNWLAPAYLSLSVVLGIVWTRAVGAAALVNAAAIVYALATSAIPVLPLPPGAEEVYGWREAAVRARAEIAALGPGAVISADRYQVAAQLAYYAPGVPVTLLPCPHPASIWTLPQAYTGRDAVALLDARWAPTVEWRAWAEDVEETPPLLIEARGRSLRTFRVMRLHGFHAAAGCPER
ncbi:MAG TPA: glycosyltransferase family 39 protein [bacterium]|nr:glycosyltransferase family 39 protein [bacterium]